MRPPGGAGDFEDADRKRRLRDFLAGVLQESLISHACSMPRNAREAAIDACVAAFNLGKASKEKERGKP